MTQKRLISVTNSNSFDIYDIVSKIGSGSSSTVYKVQHRKTGTFLAMKRTSAMSSSVRTEFTILRLISHPNIISTKEIFIDENNCSIILELLEGASLYAKIISEKHLNEIESKTIVRQILMALIYLHSNNIIHRDLKLENIVFKRNSSNFVKLIDFGSSKQVNYYRELNSEVIGTTLYMSPEVLSMRYNHKYDIWSLGVILFVLLSGSFPFTGKNKEELKKAIMTKKLTFPDDEWKGVSYEAKDLIKKMLNKNPELRLGADECLTHPWFSELKTDINKNQEKVVLKSYNYAYQNVMKQSLIIYMMVQFDFHDKISKYLSLFYDIDQNSNGIIESQEFYQMMVSVKGKEIADKEAVQH